MSPHNVIINADDFGLSADVNELILEAFSHGYISSATLMANMPAFAEACASVATNGLQGAVGLHFNLTYGQPLTAAIRENRLFCRNGHFELGLSAARPFLSSGTRHAVMEELQAQWGRCIEHGVYPSHIDSHQHVHNLWPIGRLVAEFAGAQGVPVRLARNLGRNIGPLKSFYKGVLNQGIRRSCPRTVEQVCTPRDLLDGLCPGSLLEVIAHPRRLSDGKIGDDYLPDDQPLHELLEACLQGYERINYSSL